MSLTLEFLFDDVDGYGNEVIRTVDIIDALAIPRVGDHVHVSGYRQVLNVAHYFGIPVSNGEPPMVRNDHTGMYATAFVRLGEATESPRGLA